MEKLELKHFAPYLPYKLIGDNNGTKFYLGTFDNMLGNGIETRSIGHWFNNQIKPILHPLSELSDINGKYLSNCELDLTDQITLTELANKKINFAHLEYHLAVYLFENHFDVFGLIENNLAIDINTITNA